PSWAQSKPRSGSSSERPAHRGPVRRPLVDSRAARCRSQCAAVVDGGAAPHAPQQPRPRGRRASGGARRLRRLRQGCPEPRCAAAGEKRFGSADRRGRTILTAGLGGMGGAQPLAGTMAGAAILCIEVDPSRIERRLETRYLDEATDSLDDALARVRAAAAEKRPLSVGLLGNAADLVPELAERGEDFDFVTDQTAAHDPLTGYIPRG